MSNRNNKYDAKRRECCEVIGVSYDASEQEIKQRFKKLALTHHPDKGGSHENWLEIKNAYDYVIKAKKSEDPDPWRDQEPGSKEELSRWLKEDTGNHDSSLLNDFPESPPCIHSNIFKLIEKKKLRYYDFQCMNPDKRKIFRETILQDDQLTDQIIRGVLFGDSPATVEQLLYPYDRSYSQDSFKKGVAQLQKGLEKKLTSDEIFFLEILLKEWQFSKQPQLQTSDEISFADIMLTLQRSKQRKLQNKTQPRIRLLTSEDNSKLLQSLKALGIWEKLSLSIAGLIRQYRGNTEDYSIGRLKPQLQYWIDTIGRGYLNGFEELYVNLTPVIAASLQTCSGSDEVSKNRKTELISLQNKINELAFDQVKESFEYDFYSNQQQPKKMAGHFNEEYHDKKLLTICQKVPEIINTMIDTQAHHREPGKAAMKFLACWFLAIATASILYRLSSTVREGCKGWTKTYGELRRSRDYFENCRQDLEKMYPSEKDKEVPADSSLPAMAA